MSQPGERETHDGAARLSGVTFEPVARQPRLSDKVAGMLLEAIATRGLAPGDRLPSERELGEQFGVSRTVIREAIRALAAKGVIEARSGSGLRIAQVRAATVSESIGLFLRSSRFDYSKIHEVRKSLEVDVAGLAAARATADEIEDLRANLKETTASVSDGERVAILDVQFHRMLAEASHNELYVVVLDAIGEILLEIRRSIQRLPGRPQAAVRAHRKILKGLVAHDSEQARSAMAEHLDESLHAWQRLTPANE